MIAYTSYYNPKEYNKNTSNTIEQSAYQMSMAQQRNYLDLDENPIALDALMVVLYP